MFNFNTIDSQRLNEILHYVEKPGRYCGGEYGSVKPSAKEKVLACLSYPDVYEIGFSNQGIKILYNKIMQHKNYYADLCFAPWPDMGSALEEKNLPLYGLNSRIPLKDFHLWGFNMGHELLITNVLYMLKLAGVPLLVAERSNDMPLIVLGGTSISNPLPYIDFVDAFFLGDGDEAIVEILEVLENTLSHEKQSKLEELAKIKGVYIPALQPPQFDSAGKVFVSNEINNSETSNKISNIVKKRNYKNSDFSALDYILVPNMNLVQDRIMLEANRGCGQGCRFCHAGFWKRPVQNIEVEQLVESAKILVQKTGYNEISLYSLSISDYPHLKDLAVAISKMTGHEGIQFALPSLRASYEAIPLLELTSGIKKTGLTFALESGSELQRAIIRKNISDENLFGIVEEVFKRGWNLVKVYFMLGLPGLALEEEAEAAAVALTKLGKIAEKCGPKKSINATLSLFVPKPFTTFQWEKLQTPDYFHKAVSIVKQNIKTRRVNAKYPEPEGAFIEGLLSRADHRLGKIILEAVNRGAKFDSWSEWKNWDLWNELVAKLDSNLLESWVNPIYDNEHSKMPWEFIEALNPKILQKDKKKADNTTIENRKIVKLQSLSDLDEQELLAFRKARDENILPPQKFILKQRLLFKYSINRNLVYIGHTDKMETIKKAFRRASLPLCFSQGFHKIEKLHFGPSLPLFCESEDEWIWTDLYASFSQSELVDLKKLINNKVPDGLHFHSISIVATIKSPAFSKWEIAFSKFSEKRKTDMEGKARTLLYLTKKKSITSWQNWWRANKENSIDDERLKHGLLQFEKIKKKKRKGRVQESIQNKTIFLPACLNELDWENNTLTFQSSLQGDFALYPKVLLKHYFSLSQEEMNLIQLRRVRLSY